MPQPAVSADRKPGLGPTRRVGESGMVAGREGRAKGRREGRAFQGESSKGRGQRGVWFGVAVCGDKG